MDKIKGVIILIDEFQIIRELKENMNSFLWTFRGNIQNQNNVGYVLTGSMSIDDKLIYDIVSREGVFGGKMITQHLNPLIKTHLIIIWMIKHHILNLIINLLIDFTNVRMDYLISKYFSKSITSKYASYRRGYN